MRDAFDTSPHGVFVRSPHRVRNGQRVTCDALGNPFGPPSGCEACLCKNATSFNLCVSGETGDNAVLNTPAAPVVLTGSAGVYTYEQAGVRKFVLTLTTDGALDYERALIEAYIWDGAWTLARDNVGSLVDMTAANCIGNFSEGGADYVWRARGDWTNATTLSLAFTGITYADIFTACPTGGYVDSGTLDTYAGQVPDAGGNYPHGPATHTCQWPGGIIYDDTIDVIINSVSARVRVTCTGSGAASSGKRGYTITALAATPGDADFRWLFAAEIELNEAECKGEHTVANAITASCQVYAGKESIGWGGSVTLELS